MPPPCPAASAGRRGNRARPAPTSRRRCRTSARRRSRGRSGRRSRSPRARPRCAGRRSRAASPSSRSTRAMNSTPFSAERQASVAISRIRAGSCSRSLLRQWRSASIVRSIAASRQPPGLRQALAEPDDAGKAVEHAKAVLVRAGDQQAAVVGAEVERRIERPARPARRRSRASGSASPRSRQAAGDRVRLRLSRGSAKRLPAPRQRTDRNRPLLISVPRGRLGDVRRPQRFVLVSESS